MSVRLSVLSLNVGESLQVNLGNAERTIIIGIDKHGNAFVSGPLNDKLTTLIVTEGGFTQSALRVPLSEFNKEVTEP